ncbi:hypothetical protein SDC9_138542 [bioreactor metagenome]|uniref:Uncharacterized protein n=1 Tax=bioreactor metagenome TaxID=1076179 RepID=A0A645DRT5_9ZZZZ
MRIIIIVYKLSPALAYEHQVLIAPGKINIQPVIIGAVVVELFFQFIQFVFGCSFNCGKASSLLENIGHSILFEIYIHPFRLKIIQKI